MNDLEDDFKLLKSSKESREFLKPSMSRGVSLSESSRSSRPSHSSPRSEHEASSPGADLTEDSGATSATNLATYSGNMQVNHDRANNSSGSNSSSVVLPLITLPPDTMVTTTEQSTGAEGADLGEAQQIQDTVWTRLRASLRALRDRLGGPFLVIETMLPCLDRMASSRNQPDYEDLTKEITKLSDSCVEMLSGVKFSPTSNAFSGLMLSIDREFQAIKSDLDCETSENTAQASSDEDTVMHRYRRVQFLFRQLETNARAGTRVVINEDSMNIRLNRLGPLDDARYNLATTFHSIAEISRRRSCTEGTRTEVLAALEKWLYDSTSPSLYWMDGMPGTGKTTIAHTFCGRMGELGLLAASFFCSRSLPECQDVSRIIPDIAHQLARYSIPFRSALYDVLGQTPDAGSRNLKKQFELLLDEPLRKVKDAMPEQLVVVIDALDECDNVSGVEAILDLFLFKTSGMPLKFLIASRPGVEISAKIFPAIRNKKAVAIHIHDIDKSQVKADIKKYIQDELRFIHPTESEIDQLVGRSGVVFLSAYHLVRRVVGGSDDDKHELYRSLIDNTPVSSDLHTPIDNLYMNVVKAALEDEDLEPEEIEDIRVALHTVLLAREPVDVKTIDMLAGIGDPERVERALLPLRSALHYSQETNLVAPLDSAFPEIMFDKQRSGIYFCNVAEQGPLLAQGCLLEMKDQLRFNICELDSSFLPDKQVENLHSIVKKKITPSLAYACRHWATHLISMPNADTMLSMLGEFLSERLLFWMEVLNLRQELDLGNKALLNIKQRLDGITCPPELLTLLDDAHAFLKDFSASAVSRSTPHLYLSALQLCPKSSLVYHIYSKHVQRWLEPREGSKRRWDWKPSAHHNWRIGSGALSVAFSPDGSRVAAACENGNVIICDTRDGSIPISPLTGHSNWVRCVVFSPDGLLILSASSDCTIRLWDATNGQPIAAPFRGHTHPVKSVSFSPDGKRFVSGSWDNTVRVWSTEDGNSPIKPLEGHEWGVNCVAFSPDGASVASGANDHTIRLWDLVGGTPSCSILELHTNGVMSIAFTPDGTRLVSGSVDSTICVWSTDKKALVARFLQGCTHFIYSVAVSPDGLYVASGSADSTIRVWDINNGSMIAGPLEHFSGVRTLAFSPDGKRLLSGSHDEAIKVWDLVEKPEPTSVRRGLGNTWLQGKLKSGPSKHQESLEALEKNMTRIRELHEEKLAFIPFYNHTPNSAMSIVWLLEGTHLAYLSDDLGKMPAPEIGHELPHIPNGWKWQTDGWILNDKSQLLIWVPPTSVSCELLGHTVSNSRLLSFLFQNDNFIGKRWLEKKKSLVG
ncbi:unnamed protein product [Rhizoctonia solani]|uniref:Nephrocystin 3-like N-terminal domain-containing protein n=1 Tax=Rhizoctonia solani TaxID=456999 RepID=A0A8H3GBN1_9AGAM|nr:unnamed protein product [Rhizoctonia solani]